jgi:hypothetical protein
MGSRKRFAVMVCVLAITVAGTSWCLGLEASPAGLPPAAPGSLMETGLYEAGRPGVVDPRNQPFLPQYPLWTDGETKRRWIYLPPDSTIDVSDVDEWDFPVGTKVWKEFAIGGRKIETRMLWKTGPQTWAFASYAWNADGTEAVKAPADGVPRAAELSPGRFHHIPSLDQCRACHVAKRTEILGFNALQLSTDRDPNAIHGEPLASDMVTLATLDHAGLLQPRRPELVSNPPRIAARSPEERAVLGYLAGNCGPCHNRASDLAPLGLHWKHAELTADGTGTLQAMLHHPTKWQVPGVPEGESLLLDIDRPEQSALLQRMKSRWPASQMPPLGTAVRDQQAVDAIGRWLAGQRDSR